ncbi:5'-3' exonuclease PLD3 [Geodia barretti]|uniref:5'-3' exonuclease PLD3 n=1 Tax=Geodia barretti TaxID=519541 RepID=A0AA35TIA3_GEOBA|nr:5'-3' exonuclease PLD3 [Geodia barretti]
MPLARALSEESERPLWVPELPDRPASAEDAFSRAIEHSEDEGLRFLDDLQSGRSRWSTARVLGNDSRGLAGVHVAVLCKRYRTLTVLLASGVADINQPSTNLGSTPLHFVTGRFGNRGPHLQHHIRCIVKTLIRAGVSPEATNHYGFTVLHESIMWGDVTSLCIMLEQSTAQYFKRILLIGSHVLPHELAWRLPTLPLELKQILERSFFAQKRVKESTTVSLKVDNVHDFQVYRNLECVANPSPPTVERVSFLHPESLTASQVGSLLRSAPQSLVLDVLKYQQSILEYQHHSLQETRYVFPAYFSRSLAEWVCTDCRNCRIVAGRWFGVATENLGIRYVDRVRSQGVIVQVCSPTSSDETGIECRNILDYVIESAYRVHRGIGPVSVVSSRDLRTGKKIPHLFSLSEVSQALATRKTFLPNPASMHTADTIADLLLSDTPPQAEAVERDFAPVAVEFVIPQKTPYHYDIHSCGSLDDFFLEREGPHSAPPHCTQPHPTPVGPRTAPSGRATEESGYGTQPSAQFHDLSTQPPSLLRTSLSRSSAPLGSPHDTQSVATSFRLRQCSRTVHSFVSSVYPTSVSCVDDSGSVVGACGREPSCAPTAVSVSVDLESSFNSSPPINIPRHSSSSSHHCREDSTAQPQPSAKDRAPKHLPQQTSLFQSLGLVESIPEDLPYPDGSPSHISTYQAWSLLLSSATSTIDISAYYWSLIGRGNTSDPTDEEGKLIFEGLVSAAARGVKIRVVQNTPTREMPDTDSQLLATMGAAEVRNLSITALTGYGILHTKMLVVDARHIYVGSANLDWRSLTQVKELGVIGTDCQCLAQDAEKLFEIYWYLATPTSHIPRPWPPQYDAMFNLSHPALLSLNDTPASVFWSVSTV